MVKSVDLEKEFNVTAMTIWRDIKLLEEQGQLRRVRGGAMRLDRQGESAFIEKADRARVAKERITTRVAQAHLQPGDILILDGGTTVAALADRELPPNLTILTNSLPIADRMMQHASRPTVYLSGGLLRPESGTLVGREALTFFSRRHASKLLMSATGFDADAGVTDPNPQEIEVKQAMAASAQEIILLADSSKFGVVSLMQSLPLRRLDKLITDADSRHPIFGMMEQHSVLVDLV